MSLLLAVAALFFVIEQSQAQVVAPPQLVPGVNYTIPNYNLSPIVRKFVDSLPGVGAAGANNLGNYIPLAVPMATLPAGVPSGADYYEIAVVDYTQQMHSDLPGPCTTSALGVTTCGGATAGTELRGYVQIYPPGTAVPAGAVALKNPDGTAVTYNGAQVYGYDKPRYMGPLIKATRGKAVRIKFYNLLRTTATGGSLFLPVDTTIMGAGMGPPSAAHPKGAMYSSNRAVLHLHGGDTAWISDGTPNQWITPFGETADPVYAKGVSHKDVPDMPVPPSGTATVYYTNAISGRLMFYHDHAYGTTRQDAYAGEAAGYLLTDPSEEGLTTTFVTSHGGLDIPLIIQDKSFVNVANPMPPGYTDSVPPYNTLYSTLQTDPLWSNTALNPDAATWAQKNGSLWFPHIYMPNQNPNDPSGANAMGRWDYGAWFWPIFPVVGNVPLTSAVPEAFVDTPVVNGQAYPYLNVIPTTYRFRILNACNDRFLNLQLYVASSIVSSITVTNGGRGYTVAPSVTITPAAGDLTGKGASAVATVDLTLGSPTYGHVTGITMQTVGSDYSAVPTVTIGPPPAGGTGAMASAKLFTSLTPAIPHSEVGMVPASKSFPVAWPAPWVANDTPGLTPDILDSRPGGVPDPSNMGPSFIHFGMEGGLANHAVPLFNTPVGYEQNKRSVTVLNVIEHTEYLGPAERAEVMVDFSAYAGKTIILYNDAPAPLPGEDVRNSYYTDSVDKSFQGGAPRTQAGFGPNTRTIMQFRVNTAKPQPALNVTALDTAVNAAFTATQPPLIVAPNVYSRISDTSFVTNPPVGGVAVGSLFLQTGGTGYKSVPKVTVLGGGGTGAVAYATLTNGVVTGVTLTKGGSGYTSIPAVQFTGGTPTTPAEAVADLAGSVPLLPKTIQELFDPLGRMNATLGVEIARTSATTQTTIPYGYIDPETEIIPNGGTQLWKITHNGVDTHSIHFHLFNVQVVNRIGWDGMIKPPWPEEMGWKESVKMNPLEDIVVALTAKVPTLPAAFGRLPDNVRLFNTAMPAGSTVGFFGVDPSGNPVAVSNQLANFGHEYVWHCHLLGHEENDMMRSIALAVAPPAPSGLKGTFGPGGNGTLTWTNNHTATKYTGIQLQRASDALFTQQVLTFNLGNVTSYVDKAFSAKGTYYYRVAATDTVGSGVAGYPSVMAVSSYSPTFITAATAGHAGVPTAVVSLNSPYQTAALTPVVLTWSVTAGGGQTGFTVQRATNAAFTAGRVNYIAGNVLTYSNTTAKAGTTYYYRVVPTDASGAGTPSNIVSLTAF
jgi:FtsP/CotA-like multicopper oxidase with cupredoxin domain